MGKAQRHGSMLEVAGPIAVFLAIVLTQYLLISERLGEFVYPVDDTYIHLAIGKNLARHGVWGNTEYAFASASSSLLWTLLLAGSHLLAPSAELAPLLLNAVAGTCLIFVAARQLRIYIPQLTGRILALSAFMLIVPMPLMTISGMEHLLHALLACMYLAAFLDTTETKRQNWLLGLLGMLMVSARYEGLFLIVAVSVVLALRRNFAASALNLLCGLAPVVVFGVVSIGYGAMFLPNSVAIKGAQLSSAFDVVAILLKPFDRLRLIDQKSWFVGFTILSLAIVWLKRDSFSERERLGIGLVAASVFMHAATADFGWLHRYEAYLFALTLLFIVPPMLRTTIGLAKGPALTWRIVGGAVFLLLLYPLVRVRQTLGSAIPAAKNIHDQQVQMARFIARHHDREAVAANDIGAISYFTHARVVDLFGLGSNEIARLKKAKRYTTADIDRITRTAGVKLAILYPYMFEGKQALPEEWTRVGDLGITNNVVCAAPEVSFYAVQPLALESIAEQLRQFRTTAPSDITIGLVDPSGLESPLGR